MNTNKFIYPASSLLLTSGLCFAQERDAVATTERPNVIYLLCDDMGYSDIEAYGQQMISTPNLNRLVNKEKDSHSEQVLKLRLEFHSILCKYSRKRSIKSFVDDRATHRTYQNTGK